MNKKKNIVILIVMTLFGSSIKASESSNKESFFSDNRVAKGFCIVAGLCLTYRGCQFAWDKYYSVEAKVDLVQKTCKGISSKQQKMGVQIAEVDNKVSAVGDKVIAVQNTASTILNDQKKLSNNVEQVQVVVEQNGNKLTFLDQKVATLSDKTDGYHNQAMQEFNSVKTEQTKQSKLLQLLEEADKQQVATLEFLKNIQEKHACKLDAVITTQSEHTNKFAMIIATQGQHTQELDAINTSIKNSHTEQSAELKTQGELLATHNIQLAQFHAITKKVESNADRTKRRIKSLFNCIKKTATDIQDVSDSDEEASEPLHSKNTFSTTEKLFSLDVKKQSQTQTPVSVV